jgi:hypothetical protein
VFASACVTVPLTTNASSFWAIQAPQDIAAQ